MPASARGPVDRPGPHPRPVPDTVRDVPTDVPSAGHVRAARAGDAAALADLQLACWTAAYTDVLPEHALAVIAAERAAMLTQWEGSAAAPPSGRHRVLVALDDGDQNTVAGAAATAPAEDEDLDPGADGELLVLLVAPDRRRRGHGSRLLAAAVDHLREDGFARAVGWLDDSDDAAGRLLRSSGWAPDGTVRTLDLDGDGAVLVRQERWHTDLGEAPGDEQADHEEDGP